MTGVRPEVVEHANGILASLDMMEQTCMDADKHTVDEAVYLRHTAMKLIDQAKRTIAFLDLHLLDVLEEPINHAGWQFRQGFKKDRERYDHDEIRKHIIKRVSEVASEMNPAAPQEFFSGVRVGADVALLTMSDIYLSDSTKAKVGQLDRYGIPRDPKRDDSVRTYEKGDKYIDVSPIMSEVQE